MKLELERELTAARFAEIGQPYHLFEDHDGQRVAICSSFGYLQWPGRSCYEGQAVYHRISLYDDSLQHRIAVLSLSARWTINDIAFHPSETKLLIGTGDYDGGYFFEGQLLLWDWTSGQMRSLLGERREVVRCRFNEGGTITAILRPRHEEEYWDGSTGIGSNSPDFYVEATISDGPPPPLSQGEDPRLLNLLPGNPESAGFTISPKHHPVTLTESEKIRLKRHGVQERYIIRDLLWMNDETIAAVHDGCHLELWNPGGARQATFSGAGRGVELLPSPGGGCLVNVLEPAESRSRIATRSTLLAFEGGKLATIAVLDHACSISSDSQRNILARDVEMDRDHARKDTFLRHDGGVVFQADLGKYDLFNHCLRLRGERLYLLRGTPPESHLNKVLCTLDKNGRFEELAPWDETTRHMMSPLAAFVSADHLVRAVEVYSNSASRTSVIERFCTKTGEIIWRTPVGRASFTALAAVPGTNQVVYAQANGSFGLIEATSGHTGFHSPLTIDGIPTIATALSVREDRLAVGTIDGRILMFRLRSS